MKLALRTKIEYASAAIGDAASYTFLGTYLLFFLTTVVGIDPATAGTISAIGAVWDALWSPIIGNISDRCRKRWGDRIPLVLFSAVPVGIGDFLLFSSIDAGETERIIYYTLMVIIFWTAFAAFFTSYLALGAEITDDYDERTSLRGYASQFNMIGTIVGVVLPTLIVDMLCSVGFTLQEGWQMTGAIVGVISTVTILVTALALRKRKDDREARNDSGKSPKNRERTTSVSLFKDILFEYKDILKLKPLQKVIGVALVYLIANTMFSSDRVYFMTYNLGMSPGEISLVLLINMLVGVAVVPFVGRISRATDKRKAFMILVSLAGVGMIVAKFTNIETMTGMIVLVLVYAWGNSAYWQLMPATIYDLCEVDELYSGKRREGTISSLLSLAEALSAAAGLQLIGFILDMAGFDGEAAVQTPLACEWIENMMTVCGGGVMLLAVIMMSRYTVSKEKFKMVMDILEKRKKGIIVPEDEYPDIK